MAPCTPHEALHSTQTHQMDGRQPSKLADVFGGEGGLGVCIELKVLFCSHKDALPQHWSVLRAIHTLNNPQNYISACLGGCWPSIQCNGLECKVSCGALGGRFRQRRPWSALVVLVDVGRWRLRWDGPTVGIVTTVYKSIFFYSHVDPIHSWHLTQQLKKEDLDLCTFDISWFLCPVFYGRFQL